MRGKLKKTLSVLILGICLTGSSQILANNSESINLDGLWALHTSADMTLMSTKDIQGFYPENSLTLDDQITAFGFSLRLQRHINNYFLLGVGFDSLNKSYRLTSGAGISDIYDWPALYPNAILGLSFFRTKKSYFTAELQIGSLMLYQAAFEQQGGSNTTGEFSGSTMCTTFSLNSSWFLLPSVGLHVSFGYRQGKISDVTFKDDTGTTVTPSYISDFYVDYSGPLARVGLSFYWGMDNPWGDMHEAPPPPDKNLPQ